MSAVDEATVVDERETVIAWRLLQLLRAGYGEDTAELLAARVDVDLHEAVELVERGCSPGHAAQILL